MVDRLSHYRLDAGASVEYMMEEHGAVIQALYARDPDQAEEAMLFGLERTRDDVLPVLMSQSATQAASSAHDARDEHPGVRKLG